MKKKRNFFVIEARRLIPLLFLLLLLIGLTVYDNFFRVETVGPAETTHERDLTFTTTDWGVLSSPVSFNLVSDYEEWARVSQELGLSLPDYPFNAADEIALFAVNSEVKGMELLPVLGEMQIRVLVEPKENYYHVVTVDRQSVDYEGAVWKFVDNNQQVLSRVTLFSSENDDNEGENDNDDEVNVNDENEDKEVLK
ncbi:MAG: hypothetical protein ACOX6X_03570 [Dethiobacteria bacterium]